MKTPNRNRSSNDEDDDEDDRKPPAKEIHMVTVPNKSATEEEAEKDDSPQDSNFTMPTSGETSLASTSSDSVGWVSPVARALPRDGDNNGTPSFYTPPTSKKEGPKGVPPLTAATPCSPAEDEFIRKPPATTDSAVSRVQTLQGHVYLWMATVAIAFAVFVYQILPAAALTTLLFVLASTGMVMQTVVNTARQWYYETVITGNGLGRLLLPDSLYRALTETSFHQFMTDPSFVLENRHLLLYFLPLSEEELNDSIARLAPQHRDRLYRPGLGHFMGEGLMRLLIGEPRYQRLQRQHQHQQQQPAIDISAANSGTIEVGSSLPRQRLLLTDDDDSDGASSDLGLRVAADDLAGGLNQRQAASLARHLGLEGTPVRTPPATALAVGTPTIPPAARGLENITATNIADQGNEADDYDRELQVLQDAFWGSANGWVVNPIRDYVSRAVIVPAVAAAGRLWARTGIALSVSALGLGLWGWWAGGVYRAQQLLPHSSSLPTALSSATRNSSSARDADRVNAAAASDYHYLLPPAWSLWTAALVGGTSIGLSLYARRYVRRATSQSSTSNDRNASKKDD